MTAMPITIHQYQRSGKQICMNALTNTDDFADVVVGVSSHDEVAGRFQTPLGIILCKDSAEGDGIDRWNGRHFR